MSGLRKKGIWDLETPKTPRTRCNHPDSGKISGLQGRHHHPPETRAIAELYGDDGGDSRSRPKMQASV